MNDSRMPQISAIGLVVGAILGIAGTFAPSDSLRNLAWGIDGTALIVAAALLTIYHFRRGNDVVAAGFLVFVSGEALILSGVAVDLEASAPSFAAGVALWSASLAMISAPRAMPSVVRGLGIAASLLFVVVAVLIFLGRPLTPTSRPLPFFAYPFLAATLFGWAWVHFRNRDWHEPDPEDRA
jgi:hypothetical protein